MRRASELPPQTDSSTFKLHPFVDDARFNRKDKHGRPLSKFGIFPKAFMDEVFPNLSSFENCIMLVLFNRLFDSIEQFNAATGIWNPMVKISVQEFANLTSFHPNTVAKLLAILETLGWVLITRKGVGAVNGYGVNMDKIREYKRLPKAEWLAMRADLLGTPEYEGDEDAPMEAAAMTDKPKHKAAKRVPQHKNTVIKMPAPEPELRTIAPGGTLNIDGFCYFNESPNTLEFVVKRDAKGNFKGLSFRGEQKANISVSNNKPSDSKDSYFAPQSSTSDVEVSQNRTPENTEALVGEIKAKITPEEAEFGLDCVQFRLVIMGYAPDESTADFTRVTTERHFRDRGIEVQYLWPGKGKIQPFPFRDRLREALSIRFSKKQITPAFLANVDTLRLSPPEAELVEFIEKQLRSPRFDDPSKNTPGIVYSLVHDFKKMTLRRIAPFLEKYA
jgi:hypothetical protein